MEKDICLYCKYFMQHYVKSKIKFLKTIYGHCTKKISTCNKGIVVQFSESCKKYEKAYIAEKEDGKDIEKILHNMARQINDIAAAFKHRD